MKKYLAIAAGTCAFTALCLSAAPAMAQVGVGINIAIPGVYVQERPQYVRPEYEQDWRERQGRARYWREQRVSDRHDDRHDDKHDHGKHRGRDD